LYHVKYKVRVRPFSQFRYWNCDTPGVKLGPAIDAALLVMTK